MKLSDAMEEGWESVGEQLFDGNFVRHNGAPKSYILGHWSRSGEIDACCALGAANVGCHLNGSFLDSASEAVREYVIRLNDNCKMPIPEIIEVLRGMGL